MNDHIFSAMATRLAASKRAVRALPPGTIRLDNGDPDFNTPEPIRTALAEALAAGMVHYAHPQGDPDLRAALAEQVTARAGRAYNAEQFVVTHGASGALASTILALVDRDARVLLPEPTYSLYADLVAMAGGEPVFVPTRPDFHLDLDRIDTAAATGARLLILCTPSNPTGAVYDRGELEGLAEIAERRHLVVIGDEAYDHIVYEPNRFTSLLEIEALAERLVYVQTFSKTYAMTGWRLGYLAGSASLVAAAARVHRTVNGPVNSPVQRAALTALSLSDWHGEMLAEYTRRRAVLMEALRSRAIDAHPPEGAFYAMVKHPEGVTSEQMTQRAAESGVAVRPGVEYGPSGEGYVRIAFCVSAADLKEGLDRLGSAFAASAPVRAGRPPMRRGVAP